MNASPALLFGLLLFVPEIAHANGLGPTMPVADVKAGMKCSGKTVYYGTTLEPFDCEVLGVLQGAWGPGDDVIVARLVGPNADRYGVVAGMSGSPIYVNGKLIGALSLVFGSFQKEAIAGITPIESMLRVRGAHGWPSPAQGQPTGAKTQSAWGEMRPIAAPIALSGVGPDALPIARQLLEPLGFVVSAGGGGLSAAKSAVDSAAAAKMVPGGAIAGILISGDVNVSATGTVTAVDGDSVLAFGHSFLLYGDVEMPMAAADIVATVPSTQNSFKMANPTAIVGAVTRDNRTAIAGKLGAKARMIPVTVTLPEGTTPREIRFDVFRNKVLSAPMMTLGVLTGLVGNADYDAEGTMRLDGRVKIDGFPDVTLSRTYFDPGAQGGGVPAMAAEIAAMLQKLFDNDLGAANVSGVSLSFATEKSHLETKIDSAWAERTQVKPGETVAVQVRMRPYRGPAEVREVQVKVPEGTPAGPLVVDVADAKFFDTKDRVAPGLQKADDLASLIEGFNERRSEDALYVRLTRTSAGALVRGVTLPALPPDALSVVRGADKSAGGAEPVAETTVDEVRMPMAARVTGNAEFTILVAP